MPGLFEPVRHTGRVLVDGGLVNPVPFDLLQTECDVVVAVDVLNKRTPEDDNGPGIVDNSFNSFQIMQSAIVKEKMARRAPDIYPAGDRECSGARVLQGRADLPAGRGSRGATELGAASKSGALKWRE